MTQGTLPAGLTLAASGTIAGTPSGSGSSTFTVTVTDAAQLTATAALSIAVLQPVLPVADLDRSTNWSGYTLDPGPFTYATGTLTVPSLTNLSQSVSVSEWVGIDGNTNSDLIQAGVAENYSSFTGTTEMHAWWEILPASETPIDPSVMNVQPGDTVTVTIQQLSPGSWSIALVDNATGQSFSTTQAYSGPGTSAEWIVEAPSTDTGRLTTLADYTPNVVFTRIGWAGSATQFTPIEMVDRFSGSTISIPSALSADQTSFAVAYGATAPPAPS